MPNYPHHANAKNVTRLMVLIEEYYTALFQSESQSLSLMDNGEELTLDLTDTDNLIHSRILIDKYCQKMLESKYYANC